jgi:hypothetical protein
VGTFLGHWKFPVANQLSESGNCLTLLHHFSLRDMRKRITLLVLTFLLGFSVERAAAQMAAMDFQGMDCNGNMQHLFADLDAGNAVILEFFMDNCSPCVTVGNALEAMKTDLLIEFPGMVKGYSFGFNNTYTCTAVANWVNSHGYTTSPMDSGAAQVAYYGGFGMPTVVVLGGGTNRTVLGTPYTQGFSASDTGSVASLIRGFLGTPTAVANAAASLKVTMFPNPANDRVQINIENATTEGVQVRLMDLAGHSIQVIDAAVSRSTSSISLSTTHIADGCYLVQVQTANGVSTQPLIIAH